MSSKSSKATPRSKPAKPYNGFPLTPHQSGQWAKKATLPSGKQKMYYFGAWADPDAALERFNREWQYLKDGRTPPPVSTGDGCTLSHLSNAFLIAKQSKVASGELSGHTFTGYHTTATRMIKHFGGDRRVNDLRPDDFEAFRKSMSKSMGVVALKNEINRCRIILKYAYLIPSCPARRAPLPQSDGTVLVETSGTKWTWTGTTAGS